MRGRRLDDDHNRTAGDLLKFDGDTHVDYWWKSGRIPGPGDREVRWSENRAWLDARIRRGDDFGLATNPATLPPVTGGYTEGDPNGYFTARELYYLRRLGVIVRRLW